MRVLLAHNFYRSSSPSGEDSVFRNERRLLEDSGADVIPFEYYNDDIDDSSLSKRLGLAMSSVWSRETSHKLADILKREKPDIAHFHNTFPRISPSAYSACQKHKVPVVQTLHNYRLICPGALLQRDRQPCEDCVGTSFLPALQYRCYRDSLAATATVSSMLTYNRIIGSYRNNVDTYIALTDFAASRLIAGGLPEDRITIKPNFLPDPPEPGHGKGGYAVYTGRLSAEKGVHTLLDAWKQLQFIPLKILGDGPLYKEMSEFIANEKLPIELLGLQPHNKVIEIVKDATMQIVPSEWYEGFPMVILDAFACGTPVVASRIGSLSEIITEGSTGSLFKACSPDNLSEKIQRLTSNPNVLIKMRKKARDTFDRLYTPENNLAQLSNIYNKTIEMKAQEA